MRRGAETGGNNRRGNVVLGGCADDLPDPAATIFLRPLAQEDDAAVRRSVAAAFRAMARRQASGLSRGGGWWSMPTRCRRA